MADLYPVNRHRQCGPSHPDMESIACYGRSMEGSPLPHRQSGPIVWRSFSCSCICCILQAPCCMRRCPTHHGNSIQTSAASWEGTRGDTSWGVLVSGRWQTGITILRLEAPWGRILGQLTRNIPGTASHTDRDMQGQ
jgi:hypothetical protein